MPYSGAGLVSMTRTVGTADEPALSPPSRSCRSWTLILESAREPATWPTPGTSHSGSDQPGQAPFGAARNACQRDFGVEEAAGASDEAGATAGSPQAGQAALRARILMVRYGEEDSGEYRCRVGVAASHHGAGISIAPEPECVLMVSDARNTKGGRTCTEEDAHRFARHPDPDYAAQDPNHTFVCTRTRPREAQPLVVQVFEPLALLAFRVGQVLCWGFGRGRRRRWGRGWKDARVARSPLGVWGGERQVEDADGPFGPDCSAAHERDLVSRRVGVQEVPSGGIVGAVEDEGITPLGEFGRSFACGRCRWRVKNRWRERELNGVNTDIGVQPAHTGVTTIAAESRENREGTYATRACFALSALLMPTRSSVCKTWRCRFDSSTVSWSMIVI